MAFVDWAHFSTDETCMLVRASRVFTEIENAASTWQDLLLEKIVRPITTYGDYYSVFYTMFIVGVPSLLILVVLWFLRSKDTEDAQSAADTSQRQSHKVAEVGKPDDSLNDKLIISTSFVPPAYLSNEYMVPAGSESHFVLPNMQPAFAHEFKTPDCLSIARDILDKTGDRVFRLAITRIAAQSPSSFFECMLLAKPDGSELGSCELHLSNEDGRRRINCMIFLKTGDAFARMREVESHGDKRQRSFEISGAHPKNQWDLRVDGDLTNHNAEVVNIRTSKLVAALTGPEVSSDNGFYGARFASMADTALMIIAFVAMDRIVTLVPKPLGLSATPPSTPKSTVR